MSDIRHHHRQLWLIAQRFMSELIALFGPPEAIAARHTLLRETWRQMRDWLRAGEALMRQLLLIEAAQLPKPNTRPLLHKTRARKRKLMEFSADAPAKWRVSFRVFMERRRPRRRLPALDATTPAGTPALHSDAARFHAAWPLAERAEALLRVFNDPAPYAARLARRLNATPHRAESLLRYPEDRGRVGAEPLAMLRAAAKTALASFTDTS